MASLRQWAQGARPRTFPNAVAPVLLGSGAAALHGGLVWWKALTALVVSLGFIVGVNYANDYSDGVRGVDADRVGPMRLVGSGAATPKAVLRAALGSFAVACAAGVLLAATSTWWLVLLGGCCLLAAWFYTGGSNPYGYQGFGEVAAFLCFGLAAVLGTELAQSGRISVAGALGAAGAGAFSSAVLLVNNLRDIEGDAKGGKITLAVRLQAPRTRLLYLGLLLVPFAVSLALAARLPLAAFSLAAALLLVGPAMAVRRGAAGAKLVPVLGATNLGMLAWSALLAAALLLG